MTKDAKIVLLTVALLVMIGVVMIYSSSAVYAYSKYGDSTYFVKRHLAWMGVGFAAALFCMALSTKRIAGNSRGTMFFFIILLIAVLIPGIGSEINGARRWFRFFGFGVQPSEMAKLAMIVYLAEITTRKRYLIRNFRHGFVPPLFVMGFVGGLVLMEPDMGTSVSILFIGFVMLYVAGVRLRYLISVAAGILPVLCMAVLRTPYRIKRLLVFRDPFMDARGAGFQLVQSFIALGSGGFFGVGLGGSKQKLFYLPESHTDFIFSIIGEELGFLGAAFVLMLFAVLIWFSLRISFKLKDQFGARIIFGVTMMIAFEVVVNIGMSMGLLPTKGLPLPFISYGGTSLVTHFAAMGLVFNVARGVE